MSDSSCGQKRRILWGLLGGALALPLGALVYVAAVPGNMVAFRLELMLAGNGSVQALTDVVASGQTDLHKPLPPQAAALFYTDQKGPRADKLTEVGDNAFSKQPVMASLISPGGGMSALSTGSALDGTSPESTGSLGQPVEIDRADKADRLNVTTVALRAPLSGSGGADIFMHPSFLDDDFGAITAMDIPAMMATAVFKPEKQDSVSYKGETEAEFEERESRCLATAIYFEARGEPVRGQLAVAQVIMNRMRSPNFPDTVCGVVYQGQFEKHCQFSFACDGRSDKPKDNDQWALAQELAHQVTGGEVWLPEVDYSTYYHADYVRPRWVRSMNKIDSIGNHIFYKKAHEAPYVVPQSDQQQASAEILAPGADRLIPVSATAGSAVSAPQPSVTLASTAASSAPAASTPATGLGFSGNE